MSQAKMNGKLTTLREAVERYIASAPDLRSKGKLRCQCNCFERYGVDITLPITTEKIETFRATALAAGRSPTTIEVAIGDMLGVLRGTKCKVPDRGRRLRKPRPTAKQPSLDDLSKVYAIARSAQWPRRTLNVGQSRNAASSTQPYYRNWSKEDRLRFWQALLVLTARAGIPAGDYRWLRWENVKADLIEWRVGRSQRLRRIKITPEIKQHLDAVWGLDPIYVLPITKWSVHFVRRQLKKLSSQAGVPQWRNILEKDLTKVYGLAGTAQYPTRTYNGHKVGCLRNWSDDDREAFWRAFLFLGFWTGLRIGDLRRLTWASVFPDRIEWQASKTGVPHVFPVTPDVRRHLDMVRGLDPVYVVPVANNSLHFMRSELARLCKLAGVEPFGPQMVRRASVTEWGCTIQDAGALIHGSGLGVRDHYVNPLKVLTRAAERVELPAAMRGPTSPTPSVERSNSDAFSVSLALIATLPLSDTEKAEAVRRLLGDQPKEPSQCS